MSHYSIGRAYEYRARRALEADGWLVVRSAGSKGPWDLVAFKDGYPVRCIQIKRASSEASRDRLLQQFQPDTGVASHRAWRSELWVWYQGQWHEAS